MTDRPAVGSRLIVKNGEGEVAVKVLGYHGDDYIVSPIDRQGEAFIAVAALTKPSEEVKYIPGEAEDGNGPAIGWMELGDLSVALTRDREGTLLVSVEKSPDSEHEGPVKARIILSNPTHVNDADLWSGEIE